MRTAKWSLLPLLILGLVFSSAFAQSEQEMTKRQQFDAQRKEAMVLVGQELRDAQGEDIGEVDNVIITPDGKVFAVLSVGGFLGFGDERVLVPFETLQTTEKDYVVYPGTQEELEALPTYREGRSRQYIRRNYRMVDRQGKEVALDRSGMPRDKGVATENKKGMKSSENERVDQKSVEGNRLISTLTFPAPEGRGAIVVERDGLQQVRSGQAYDYTLQVTNDSEYPVMDVTIKEVLSDNIAIEGAKVLSGQEKDSTKEAAGKEGKQAKTQTPPGQEPKDQMSSGAQMQKGGNQWAIGTLMPGESKKIEVSGVAKDVGKANSCLVVDFKPSLCSHFEVVKPELELERNIVDAEGNPIDRAFACDEIYFVYKLTNTGTGTTEKATIKEMLPETFKSEKGKKDIELAVNQLDAGKTAENRVAITAQDAARYQGRAEATAGKLKVNSNAGSIVIMKPDLQVSIDGPAKVYLGRQIQYHVRVENTSDAPALDTVVTLEPGENLDHMSVSRQKMEREGNEFRIGKLEAGQSREFTVSFDAQEPGEVISTVMAKAYCAQEKSEKVTTNVVGIPAVQLEVIDRSDPVKVGDTTTYEIRVKNQGSAEDLNVAVRGKLPPEMSFVKGDGDTEVSGNGQQVQFGKIDSLSPGDVASWTVEAKANKAGKTKFRLELSSDANPKPVIEMEPTTVF